MRPFVRSLLAATALLIGTSPSWAAREFTPQAGLWMIPSEIDGKPGRGFSLDVQGNTAFLQIFNYEKSGAATFHTAVGKLDEQASMTVPLQRFKGGRYFGGPAQDAVSDGSVGNVTVKFSDGLNGTVQFPGESEQPVARYLVPEKLPLWWTQLSDDPPSGKEGIVFMYWTATSPSGVRNFWNLWLRAKSDGLFSLTLHAELPSIVGPLNFDCRLQNETRVFDCAPTSDASDGGSTAKHSDIRRLKFRILGRDVVGTIQPASAPTQRMSLNGWHDGSFSCNSASVCNMPVQRSARVFSHVRIASATCITGACGGYNHVMLQPISGAWVIDDENNGKLGRGIFLDVQDDTLIVQTSDYQPNGEPTFHLGVAKLVNSMTMREPTTAAIPLSQFAGGRYFGGPAKSGQEVANAGVLEPTFAQRYGAKVTDFATADVLLPNEEGIKRIRKVAFESYEDVNAMLGEYLIKWRAGVESSGWLRLIRSENGYAYNDDGTTVCRRYSGESSTTLRMVCTKTIPNATLTDPATIDITLFNRGVMGSRSLIQTRDRHGHWLGLGNVNLPGLAIPAE